MENLNSQVQPQTQYVVVKKKSKAKWIIIAIIAVIIIAAMGSSGGSEDKEPTIEAIGGSSDVQNGETAKPSTDSIKPGTSVTNDGITIIYKSCDTDFKNYSKYADVKDGYKIIQAVFDFENNSDSDMVLDSFYCYADGVKCESFYSVDDYSSPTLESVSAGKKFLDARVYFEVPENAEKIELEYEYDFWNESKYVFIVE